MLTTTLNDILAADPCTRGWCELTGQSRYRHTWVGSDEPITILHILDNNGFDDAMWAVRSVTDYTKFSAWCCYLVKKYFNIDLVTYEDDYFSAGSQGVFHGSHEDEQDYYIAPSVMMTELIAYLKGDSNVNDNAD